MISLCRNVMFFSAVSALLTLSAQTSRKDTAWTPEQSRKYEQHFLQSENPLGFPEYLQIVTVKYASPEAAEKAELTFPGLPDEQELAFSTRWDDVNNRHLKMSELLKKHKMKGTFFLTRPGDSAYYEKIADKLLENGCAIGSHTITHPSLPQLIPNEAFRQMMQIRPELEANLDTCVVSFVLPGCALGSRIESQTAPVVGKTIQRCGYLSNPEFWPDNEKRYGLKPGTCFATHLFDANDKNPTMERFEKGLKRQLEKIKKDPSVPHVTLGLHTWQNDKGFEVLDRIFAKYGHNPNWWYCHENEYAAYRYQHLHSKIEKAERNGSTVTYTIRRITPHHLGSDIPLSLKFSIPPVSVEGSKAIAATRRGLYKLPHDEDRQLPQYVELIRNAENQPLNAAIFESKKFPGLFLGLHWDEAKKQLQGFFLNRSRVPLKQIGKTIYFPMQWKTPVRSMKTWEILPGNRDTFLFTPPEEDKSPVPEFSEGTHLYVLQCDFLMDGKAQRLYATTEVRQPFIPAPCPRDTAVFMGPLPQKSITETLLAKLSVPGRKLENTGGKVTEIWQKQAYKPEMKSYVVSAFGTDKAWLTEAYALFKEGKGEVLIALDFESPENGKTYQVFCRPGSFREAWLNGQKLPKLPKLSNTFPIKTVKGLNRLIVVRKPVSWSQTSTELTVAGEDPFKPVKCIQPEF